VRVLGLDTATGAAAVALADVPGPGLLLEARDDPEPGERPGHARRLLTLVQEVLDAGEGWPAVERIAVGIGPGTFTGLRIGVATAQALARGRGIPLVGVSSLAALAVEARAGDAGAPVLAVIDARRGEAFAAAWAAGADPASAPASVGPSVLGPQALAELARSLPGALAVGDGAVKFRSILEEAGVHVPGDGEVLHRVAARAHCRLSLAAAVPAPASVQPAYLRRSDAELAQGT
jgi:tRNA threonylcarbamoyladenosine biosynthesis protein TsaB